MLISIDFETYSEAGYEWNPQTNKWINNGGIGKTGAAVYAEHPSTEVLCLYYRLPDGSMNGWIPGQPVPQALFDCIKQGDTVYARNSAFEYFIWKHVCHERMGWPELPIGQLMDDQALSLAWGMPASLDKCGKAMGVLLKVADGKRLIRKFSVPRNPTKNDPRKRIRPEDDPVDAFNLYHYCMMDVEAEEAISNATPPLNPFERQVFLLDQKINTDGCQIDTEAVDSCIAIVDQAMEKYTAECMALTGGIKPSEAKQLAEWLVSKGVPLKKTEKGNYSLKSEIIQPLLEQPLPPNVKRVIELRLSLGAASVKKIEGLKMRTSRDGRLRGMFQYCGASNTGRFAGRGTQPQNLPNCGGMYSMKCEICGSYYGKRISTCSQCGAETIKKDWCNEAAERVLRLAEHRDLSLIETEFGDAIETMKGVIRGLFISAPGHDLICSDYSAIEARVIAFMSGEEWRMDVFRTHGKIYEASASKITGVPFEEFMRVAGYFDLSVPEWWKAKGTDDKHKFRKLGKVAELASGYQGGMGAWKNFGADKFLTDAEISSNIKKWRAESPKIKQFWYTLQNDAIRAIKYPCHRYGMYVVEKDVLYCILPSGRRLQYHAPRIGKSKFGGESITFMMNNNDSTKGPVGWFRFDTFGGRLCENIIQAVSRDILCWAMVQLEKAGYKIVMHVHDEIIVEVPEGQGSVEEVERIMGSMPTWCADWPITAAGGWRGKRYRKD